MTSSSRGSGTPTHDRKAIIEAWAQKMATLAEPEHEAGWGIYYDWLNAFLADVDRGGSVPEPSAPAEAPPPSDSGVQGGEATAPRTIDWREEYESSSRTCMELAARLEIAEAKLATARAALEERTRDTAEEIAIEIERLGKRIPLGAEFKGGDLHEASCYNVYKFAARLVRAVAAGGSGVETPPAQRQKCSECEGSGTLAQHNVEGWCSACDGTGVETPRAEPPQ